MNGGILVDGVLKLMENGKMEITQYTFFDILFNFYIDFIPFILFILCYLLFKKPPNKKAYLHLGVVIFLVVFKHWATIFDLDIKADEVGFDLKITLVLLEYFFQSLLTAIICISILVLMHRPSNIGYDKILKKEIWGVWYQENNSTEYFEKREQKFQKELKDE